MEGVSWRMPTQFTTCVACSMAADTCSGLRMSHETDWRFFRVGRVWARVSGDSGFREARRSWTVGEIEEFDNARII